ncbi:hypothetical protein ACC691_39185, partial [Rhizobium johnstonii]|uniref:hypothetical protein n=1 Tax=Rhizobium johnstonii TaxID=3019933 RepID=UPI003F9B9282
GRDAFFAAAAQAAFHAVTTGQADARELIAGLVRAGDENRVAIWSSDASEQKRLEGTTLGAHLPARRIIEVDAVVLRPGEIMRDREAAE